MAKLEFKKGQQIFLADLDFANDEFVFKAGGKTFSGKVLKWDPPFFALQSEGRVDRGYFYSAGDWTDVHLSEGTYRIRFAARGKSRPSASHGPGGLSSPMPGKVIKLLVHPGDRVKKGALLLVLEAMKMEHKILSPQDGVVKKISFKEGERVSQDIELIEIEDFK